MKVFVRVKPGQQETVRIVDDHVICFKRQKEQNFWFDQVFGPDCGQDLVFEATTRPLIDGCLQGFNSTVFAYGATGCGKTHTITGSLEDPGIISRVVSCLFRDNVELSLSFLEVYNERIRDLLHPSSVNLDLREDESKVSVAGLTVHHPKNAAHLMQMLLKGNANRTQAFTCANSSSSRSHAVLQIYIKVTNNEISETQRTLHSTLSIIDLAGSERASRTRNKGDRLLEGANINRSLLALGNCINALCSPKPCHIPYRDSKLTRLLKHSLSGNCQVVMIANISAEKTQCEETQNTLKYAERAKGIKTNAVQNTVDVEAHISEYPRIIAALKNEIAILRDKNNQETSTEDAEMYEAFVQRAGRKQQELVKAELEIVASKNKLEMHERLTKTLEAMQKHSAWVMGSDADFAVACLIDEMCSANAVLLHNISACERRVERFKNEFVEMEASITNPVLQLRFTSVLSLFAIERLTETSDALAKYSTVNLDLLNSRVDALARLALSSIVHPDVVVDLFSKKDEAVEETALELHDSCMEDDSTILATDRFPDENQQPEPDLSNILGAQFENIDSKETDLAIINTVNVSTPTRKPRRGPRNTASKRKLDVNGTPRAQWILSSARKTPKPSNKAFKKSKPRQSMIPVTSFNRSLLEHDALPDISMSSSKLDKSTSVNQRSATNFRVEAATAGTGLGPRSRTDFAMSLRSRSKRT